MQSHPKYVFNNTTGPHQLHWGDWEMGTGISCSKGSQVDDPCDMRW